MSKSAGRRHRQQSTSQKKPRRQPSSPQSFTPAVVQFLTFPPSHLLSPADVLLSAPELSVSQSVMRVTGVRGENIYELEAGDGSLALYSLPSRLRHVVFIRPGSYVLAEADEARAAKGKVSGDIDAVVLDLHLAEMRRHPRWPARFARQGGKGVVGGEHAIGEGEGESEDGQCAVVDERGLGEDEEGSSSESELEGNPNRRKYEVYSDEESE